MNTKEKDVTPISGYLALTIHTGILIAAILPSAITGVAYYLAFLLPWFV